MRCVFEHLVRIEARGSIKRNSLVAAAVLHHASMLTASVCGHQVRCIHVCQCARENMPINLVRKEMFTAVYATNKTTTFTSYSCLII